MTAVKDYLKRWNEVVLYKACWV